MFCWWAHFVIVASLRDTSSMHESESPYAMRLAYWSFILIAVHAFIIFVNLVLLRTRLIEIHSGECNEYFVGMRRFVKREISVGNTNSATNSATNSTMSSAASSNALPGLLDHPFSPPSCYEYPDVCCDLFKRKLRTRQDQCEGLQEQLVEGSGFLGDMFGNTEDVVSDVVSDKYSTSGNSGGSAYADIYPGYPLEIKIGGETTNTTGTPVPQFSTITLFSNSELLSFIERQHSPFLAQQAQLGNKPDPDDSDDSSSAAPEAHHSNDTHLNFTTRLIILLIEMILGGVLGSKCYHLKIILFELL
jgi:hypothetical protein